MKSFTLLLFPGLIFFGAIAIWAAPGSFSDVPVTDETVIVAAKFAIEAKAEDMQNEKKSNLVQLKLLKLISAQQQVVSGINYKLKLYVSLDGEKKEAEAVVWWQSWRQPDPYQLTSWTWM
nr:cystatin domain-containing protein [uncultured Desulfobacter sp.]